ncbi:MAG: hydrogenase iron-sulfur subunit [Chloroflexi bacterium]|nr:hydrogenase iron-sulfur subunit [Chloroflexota bacterium]
MKADVKKLQKWERELNTCIRCGYCYEHCPLFKSFNWESDTPRGKLLLVYGLLTGELEPSEYIAEKLSECFYCKNCEQSCSAKVPVTEILTAGRELLITSGFDVEGTTAKVNESLCSGCGICVPICKHEAISLEEIDGRKQATIDKIKCQGCGICVSACPSAAISQREVFGVSQKELLSKATDFLGNSKRSHEFPKAVVFCCNWSIYPELQFGELLKNEDSSSSIIVTMCTGRIDPELIIQVLQQGAWGVLIAACPLGECEHDGNYIALRKTILLKSMLQQVGIDPKRVSLEWVAKGEFAKLRNAYNNFRNELVKLGPIGE